MHVRGMEAERIPCNQDRERITGLRCENPRYLPAACNIPCERVSGGGRNQVNEIYGKDMALVEITVAAMIRFNIRVHPIERAERILELVADCATAPVVNAVSIRVRCLTFQTVAQGFLVVYLETVIERR